VVTVTGPEVVTVAELVDNLTPNQAAPSIEIFLVIFRTKKADTGG